MRVLMVLGIAFHPVALTAERTATCNDSTVYFEYQLTTAAQWRADSVATIRPNPRVRNPANLVQFIVDSNGVPEPRTFRALRTTDSSLVAEARRAFIGWRYSPPRLDGCHVRQVVQTAIER